MGAPLVIFLRLLSTYNQIQVNTGDIINLPSRGHLFLTYKRYATLPRSLCLIYEEFSLSKYTYLHQRAVAGSWSTTCAQSGKNISISQWRSATLT